MKAIIIFCTLLLASTATNAQIGDSTFPSPRNTVNRHSLAHQMILPISLFTYGVVALNSNALKSWDIEVKEEVWTEHPHQPFKVDNYAQYLPGLSVYGLHALGISGKNDLWTASKRYLIAEGVMSVIVQSVKRITKITRPDGFGENAFPSGHTATAFVGAEFLNQEYGSRSKWYSIAGYLVASAVGYMRLYNNRHWMRDVIAGAGVGIGTTKLVYGLAKSGTIYKARITRTAQLY
jgi:hypothetical protein